MKFKRQLLFFLIPTLLSGFHCKKDKSPEEQLPPETQVGAGTFGCLVNGNLFKPQGDPFGGPILNCSYQNINNIYYFGISARRDDGGDCKLSSIGFGTDSIIIKQNQKYLLVKRANGFGAAQYVSYPSCGVFIKYLTSDSIKGELLITYLDEVNRIVSGTFWFDAVNSSNEKVEIRNGRFDMKYSL